MFITLLVIVLNCMIALVGYCLCHMVEFECITSDAYYSKQQVQRFMLYILVITVILMVVFTLLTLGFMGVFA
jgi:hypothetical protein